MASPDRTSAYAVALLEALRREPYAFHFFQALRRLECLYREQPRLGKSSRLAEDPVRLAQEPSLAFAPSTLAGFQPGDEERPARLTEYFLGLFGPNGPLPLHLTEYVRDRSRNVGDHTLARFADVFHHRMLCLFYRAWADTQPTVSFDRPETDRFNVYVGASFGLGMPSLWQRDAVPDLAKFHYAGRLSNPIRNAEGLEAILADFFKLPAMIETFVGHWLPLAEVSRCRLGESPETGLLGMTAVIGERVWDCQYRFRIVMGPMGLADFQRFLPGSDSLRRLVDWVRNYIGDELLWDVNLVLRKEEVPPLALGEGSRLGWTTWLNSQPPEHDADELKLDAVTYCS
ncbi:MAG TPA: type VI secretion system baseplate subunit TssG [Candidatus Competibacteraceae bacterium]|nr:MAG: type VI secretion system baseplate subunit TssG [Candidatus Competibacteraceae bacterium]HOB62081.1 type VI secretion system baseplate subunit TssG [Candidatus Competibacteraceae bacterium]HQA27188.1 type VI secretion system baseplate subunit TssG [Candidatus Competibacteraceae bacterium]HQD55204.1 type VI secretion system baseplate subunit TssG [Candidatus Competibacteraceae bacterium]